MFFLIVNKTVGKYYQSFKTQFLIGCFCYIITYFVMQDVMDIDIYNKYKYYLLTIFFVDGSYLIYKHNKECKKMVSLEKSSVRLSKETSSSDIEISISDIPKTIATLSDLDDVKIGHDMTSDEQSLSSISLSEISEKK